MCPEFLREGSGLADFFDPPFVVLGTADQRVTDLLTEMFSFLHHEIRLVDVRSAEALKFACNAFHATKVSFANEMARIFRMYGVDSREVMRVFSEDRVLNISPAYLMPGFAFGGSCLPKDVRAFIARAGEIGAGQSLLFLHEVDAINLRRRERVAEIAAELVGGTLIGRKVAVLGAAFKPHSDDVRDSPALNVAGRLQLQGAHVAVYDPQATENARRIFPTLEYASSAYEACRGAHVVLHLTEWPEFRKIDPSDLATVVAQPNVVDGRNCLDADAWRAAGWTYRSLGRP